MLKRTICGLLALAGLGCGAEPTYVEFGEVCGEAGPVRVLELRPGERLVRRPQQVGERVVFSVGTAPPNEAGQSSPQGSPNVAVWSSGRCGEAPRRLAVGISGLYTFTRWPEVLLACDPQEGVLLVLDPEGVTAPHALFAGLASCAVHFTSQGLVSLVARDEDAEEDEEGDGKPATLQLHRYPADPYDETVEATVLLEGVRTRTRSDNPSSQLLRVFDEFALVVTVEDELLRVDLEDGAMTRVQTGVAAFLADAVGRYVLWQDTAPTDDQPQYPAGKLFLRDRSDSTDIFLGEAALAFNTGALRYIERGFIYLNFAVTRVFSLPEMGFAELPDLGWAAAALDEVRWLMLGKGIYLVDILSGEVTALYRGAGALTRVLGDGIELLQVPPCCQRSTQRAEGPLWFISFEGEARRLAARASRFSQLFADGRRTLMLDISDDWRGTLVLHEVETQQALRIDAGVYVEVYVAPQVFGEDVVVYSIPRGGRAGIWIARLPPG